MKIYRIFEDRVGDITPWTEIAFTIGRIIGYILMFGAGFAIGSIIRGIVLGILYGPAV